MSQRAVWKVSTFDYYLGVDNLILLQKRHFKIPKFRILLTFITLLQRPTKPIPAIRTGVISTRTTRAPLLHSCTYCIHGLALSHTNSLPDKDFVHFIPWEAVNDITPMRLPSPSILSVSMSSRPLARTHSAWGSTCTFHISGSTWCAELIGAPSWSLVMARFGSEPRFEPEPMRTEPKFGSRFGLQPEPNLRSSSRFGQIVICLNLVRTGSNRTKYEQI